MLDKILSIFIKNYQNTQDEKVRKSYGTFAGTVGIMLNILLFSFKLIAGLITGAVSIVADALNNLTDAASSIVTVIGFKIASKSRDEEHPFGHGRMEYVSGLIVSFIIMIVGVELFKSSIDKIIHPEALQFGILPIAILIGSILVKLFMALFNRNLSRRIKSSALMAVAIDSISDVCATSAVLIGLVVATLSGFNPDGYIGILVSCFIVFSGIKAAQETLSPLLGSAPDDELVQQISDTVCSHENVIGLHDLMVHDYGPGRKFISLHAEVPADSEFADIHDEIDLIENELQDKYNCNCTIHMDPVHADDEFSIELKRVVKSVLKGIDTRLTYHDFRYVTGQTHTNLIFDVLAPFDLDMTDEKLVETVKTEIHNVNESYFAVLKIDRGNDLNKADKER